MEWTAEMEICLLRAMAQCGTRLVGKHKHFEMIQLLQSFNKISQIPLTVTDLWKQCKNLWNLSLLENMSDGQLPMISRHGQIAEGSSEQTGDYGDYPVDFTLYPVDEFHPLMEQRINQSVLESDGDLSSEPDNVETKTGVAGHKDPTGKSARTHKQKQQRIADSPQTSPTQSGRRSRLPRQTSPSRDDAAISKTNSPQQMLPPTALPKRITRKRPSSREGSPATSAGTKKSRESSPMRSETANNSPSPSAVATRRGLSTAQDRQNPLTYSSAAKPNKRSSVRPAVANDEGSGASSATMKIGRRSLRKH